MSTGIRARWATPLLCAAIGALLLAAYWIGGDPGSGAGAFGVMLAVGALFRFGTRSETLQGVGGAGRDERWALIDLRATAAAGIALTFVVLGAFLYELARGHDGSPWGELGAVAGFTYVVAVLALRMRT